MFEIGRIVIKIAGRDAKKKGIIVDIIDDDNVLIDGEVRRRKCNIKHLEIMDKTLKIKQGADHGSVVEALSKEGINIPLKKSKPKTTRPKKIRGSETKKRDTEEKKAKQVKLQVKTPEKTTEKITEKTKEKVEEKTEKKTPDKVPTDAQKDITGKDSVVNRDEKKTEENKNKEKKMVEVQKIKKSADADKSKKE